MAKRKGKDKTKQPTTSSQLDSLDKTILNLVTAHPDYTNNQIANKVVSLGECGAITTVYDRLSKNPILNQSVDKLRQFYKEDNTRTIFPLARDVLKDTLESEDVHPKDKLGYVKLAYALEYPNTAESSGAVVNQQINIDSIQVLINNAVDKGNV